MHLHNKLSFIRVSWLMGKTLQSKGSPEALNKDWWSSRMRSYWSQSYNIGILLDFLVVALKERRGFWYMNTCQTIAWIHIFSVCTFVSFNSILFPFVYSCSFIWYRCHKTSFTGLEITFLHHRRDCPRDSLPPQVLEVKNHS